MVDFNCQVWVLGQSIFSIIILLELTLCAVVPPPWANPKQNPCAILPRGWQMLYWPPDGNCYKIFQIGYPCPEGMELSPGKIKDVNGTEQLQAECRCPPKTALHSENGRCYQIFTAGPCEKEHYLSPAIQKMHKNKTEETKRLSGPYGYCRPIKKCNTGKAIKKDLFWPQTGSCYPMLERGPCSRGQLLTQDGDSGLAVCKCDQSIEIEPFRHRETGMCFQHFTRGPCQEPGHLFLPNRSCGCGSHMAQFHDETKKCYEIGTVGPCNKGELFRNNPDNPHEKASCQCKESYIRYHNTTSCYRPYTQGPCPSSHILINTTTCIIQPCPRGYLYFPDSKCYRIGTSGPCAPGLRVTFDLTVRPSIDGVSYRGICGCDKEPCTDTDKKCAKGFIRYNKQCYELYQKGPCGRGAWLVVKRGSGRDGSCDCMPGYTPLATSSGEHVHCLSPTVMLADYLNRSFNFAAQNSTVLTTQ